MKMRIKRLLKKVWEDNVVEKGFVHKVCSLVFLESISESLRKAMEGRKNVIKGSSSGVSQEVSLKR